MEVVLCYSAGAKNFDVAARFFLIFAHLSESFCQHRNIMCAVSGVPQTVYFIACLKCFLSNKVFIC